MEHAVRVPYTVRWTQALSIYVLARVVMALGSLLAIVLHQANPAAWPFVSLVSSQVHDDSGWYIAIASKGYWPEDTPFFPLYPVLIHAVSSITGLTATTSALIVSNGLFLADLYLLWLLAGTLGQRTWLASMLWALSPMAIYLSSAYTEPLFVLGLLVTLYGLQHRAYGWASIGAAVACLSRNEGIVLAIPYLVYLVSDLRAGRKAPRSVLWLLVPMIALAVYPMYLWMQFGHAMLFSDMESLWGRHFLWPWLSLYRGFMQLPHLLVTNGAYGRLYYCIQAGSVLFALVVLWAAWGKVPRSWWWMSLAMILIPLADPGTGLETITLHPRRILDYFFSFDRFTIPMIPLWLGLSMRIRGTPKTMFLALSAFGLVVTSTLISSGYFLG